MKSFRPISLLFVFLTLSCQSQPVGPVEENPTKEQPTTSNPITVCSFNIQFLGGSKLRDHESLAKLMSEQNCDLVVVQELVAPPHLLFFPPIRPIPTHYQDSKGAVRPLKYDDEATAFVEQMKLHGFDSYWLSEADTGPGDVNHLNSSATEWWITFYKSSIVVPDFDLPNGFLAQDLTNHPDYERVPYAFSFKTLDGKTDFVLISVHLMPGGHLFDRRRHELESIQKWIAQQKLIHPERDYVILGDMNIDSESEMKEVIPSEYVSLNQNPVQNTNTNVRGPKPYDHVLISPEFSREIPFENNFTVVNLIEQMSLRWTFEQKPYPGFPEYQHDLFRIYYSDHHPVIFKLNPNLNDDD